MLGYDLCNKVHTQQYNLSGYWHIEVVTTNAFKTYLYQNAQYLMLKSNAMLLRFSMIGCGTDIVVLVYLSIYALPTVSVFKHHSSNPKPTVSDSGGAFTA